MAPQKSLKRKADELCEAPAPKKIREETIEDNEDTEYSDSSSSEEDEPSQPTLTPGSPLTTYSTPRTPREKNFHCHYPNCNKSFNRPCRLEEHIRTHTNERPFACTQCTKTFVRDSHLRRHVKSAHTSERAHICDWPGCGKGFATAQRLRRHVAAHESKEPYRCTAYPPCNAIFRKHATLQKHITSVHLNQKPFPCKLTDETTGQPCTHGYETESALRAHQGRVHGGSRFVCSICSPDAVDTPAASADTFADTPSTSATPSAAPVSFPTYATLQAHIKTAHPPQCPHCNRICLTPRELRQHIEIAHDAVPLEARQTFKCDFPGCGRGFTRQGNLSVHKRSVHANLKPFVCGETDLSTSKTEVVAGWFMEGAEGKCGSAYGTKANLEEHVRTKHLGLENAKTAKARKKAQEKGEDLNEVRKARMSRKKGTAQQETLASLTGVGFEELGRTIMCLVPGCEHKFMREYDLQVHCRAAHSMSDAEIQEAEAERDALAGGPFWIGGGGSGGGYEAFFDEEELEANAALDREAGISADFMPVDPALLGGAQQESTGLEAVQAYLQQEG